MLVRDVDSPLGRWRHAEWRPPRLAGLVDVLWYFEGAMALPRERHFPHGRLEIVLHLGPRFREVEPTVAEYPLACLAGQQTAPFVIEAPAGACRVLGVRLHPPGARALLGVPLAATTGLTVDLADLAGHEAADLTARCADAPTPAAVFALAVAWIERRLSRAPTPDGAVAWAAAELARTHGAVPIAALQQRTGLSRARLAAGFRDVVGLTPKRYARVLRFRRALALLHGLPEAQGRDAAAPDPPTDDAVGEARTLSTLALAAGYYDQAHMNADFRALARTTPGALLAATRYPDSPSVAEPG